MFTIAFILSIYIIFSAISVRITNKIYKLIFENNNNLISNKLNPYNIIKTIFSPVIIIFFILITILSIYSIGVVLICTSFSNFFNWIAFGKLNDFKLTLNPNHIKF